MYVRKMKKYIPSHSNRQQSAQGSVSDPKFRTYSFSVCIAFLSEAVMII